MWHPGALAQDGQQQFVDGAAGGFERCDHIQAQTYGVKQCHINQRISATKLAGRFAHCVLEPSSKKRIASLGTIRFV